MNDSRSIWDVFRKHRTIRRYRSEAVTAAHLETIIDAGRRAPTDASAQFGTFIRITDGQLRARLAGLCSNQRHIMEAAEFFVVCLDTNRLRRLVEYRGGTYASGPYISLLFGIVDASLMAQNMLVAAETLGYGTCFVGAVQENSDRIARELDLPPGVLPIVGLVIGVPEAGEKSLPPRPRVPRQAVFFENGYPDLSDEMLEACFQAMSGQHPTGDWYNTLKLYFTPDGKMLRRDGVLRRALDQQGFDPGK